MTQQPPAGRRPFTDLAAHLVRLRTAARLPQTQLAKAACVSRGAVQRAESGLTAPSPGVLRAYIEACRGTAADQRTAQQLRARGRAAQRGRLAALKAPHPAYIRTRADLVAALAAAYETAGAPPLRDFTRTAPGGKRLSLGTAWRIVHRRALPANTVQLETYLTVCQVPDHHLQHYRDAYTTLTATRPPRRIPRHAGLLSRPITDLTQFRPEAPESGSTWQTVGIDDPWWATTIFMSTLADREARLNGLHPDGFARSLLQANPHAAPYPDAGIDFYGYDRNGKVIAVQVNSPS